MGFEIAYTFDSAADYRRIKTLEKELNEMTQKCDSVLDINYKVVAHNVDLLAEIEVLKGNTAVARHVMKQNGVLMRENERLKARTKWLEEECDDLVSHLIEAGG